MTKELTIATPDDWHLHLRDGDVMAAVLPYSARHFGRALVMPNLVPPVVTTADAAKYRARIMANLPKDSGFDPKMALYLTAGSSADDIEAGFRDGVVQAVKLYPSGATTNSESGVQDIADVMGVLERMALAGVPLCVHGEVTDPDVDIFDREAVFIERILGPLRERLPELRIVMEHVTTSVGVDFVRSCAKNTAATITPHHLMINRNAILAGGIRPHYYCLPVAKRESHRLALCDAATSGDKRFFLGTDSAPHPDAAKQSACGCAGIFCAPNAIACCAHIFEAAGALAALEGFTSRNGAAYYGLAPNASTLTLRKRSSPVAFERSVSAGDDLVTVFDPSTPIHWEVVEPAG